MERAGVCDLYFVEADTVCESCLSVYAYVEALKGEKRGLGEPLAVFGKLTSVRTFFWRPQND